MHLVVYYTYVTKEIEYISTKQTKPKKTNLFNIVPAPQQTSNVGRVHSGWQ